jgi:transcriptional regulator with XRE-family HTH domain
VRRLQPAAGGAEAKARAATTQSKGGRAVVLLRQEIGDVLRDARREQGRTLREVSAVARVSLGYLSEVERGQKEASSELLASICGALDVPLSSVLHRVSERVAQAEGPGVEGVLVPDTVPEGLATGLRQGLVSAA